MDKTLPKHLVLTLESLLHDSMLTSWTVQGNSHVTSVTIRFKMAADHDSVQPRQDSCTKYKRVPPSQVERDRVRSQQWNTSTQTNDLKSIDKANNSIVPIDGTIPKQTTSVPPSNSNTQSHTKTKQQTGSSVTTRSRSRLNSAAEPFIPSPVPQVDGTTDQPCAHINLDNIGLTPDDCEYLIGFLAKPEVKQLFDFRDRLPACKEYFETDTNQGEGYG